MGTMMTVPEQAKMTMTIVMKARTQGHFPVAAQLKQNHEHQKASTHPHCIIDGVTQRTLYLRSSSRIHQDYPALWVAAC